MVLVERCFRCREIVLDETHVYFTALGPTNTVNAGVLAKISKLGGAVTTLAKELVGPQDLALRDGTIFWVDSKRGVIERVSIDGDDYALIASGLTLPTDVDVDELHVYWTDAGQANAYDGSLARAPIGGGPPEELLAGLDQPQMIALLGDSVVWVEGAALRAMPTAGGAAWTVASEQVNPWTLVAGTDDLLYWASKGEALATGSIQRIDLLGGAVEALVTGLDVPWDLALDDERIFWTNLEVDSTILFAPRGGGDPQIAVADQGRPEGIAVDETHVFWADFGLQPDYAGGRLVRLLKP